jgi:D-amino-acid oxidase
VVLLEARDFQVTIYAARVAGGHDGGTQLPPLVSHVACALWLPMWSSLVGSTRSDYERKELEWARRSYLRFAELGSEAGVDPVKHHEFFTEDEVRQGLTIPPEYGTIFPSFEQKWDRDLPVLPAGIAPLAYRQTVETLTVATPLYLAWLRRHYCSLGGLLQAGVQFGSLDEIHCLEADVVINCLGLGASYIFNDDDLTGRKGEILVLPRVEKFNVSLGWGEYCIIPRRDALILGSLYLSSFEDGQPERCNAERILQVVARWPSWIGASPLPENFQSLSRRFPVDHLAGIRPCRKSGVRLHQANVDGMDIIHNYGHGGGGVSLSWGCAEYLRSLLTHH